MATMWNPHTQNQSNHLLQRAYFALGKTAGICDNLTSYATWRLRDW